MNINLSEHEAGTKFKGKYGEALEALQERISRVLVAHIVERKRSVIVLEGWDASGKGGAIQRLTAKCDPRAFQVWPIGPPTEQEKARHFLWRFWNKLPAAGEIGIFDRSWYGRVLVERVEGFASEAEWRRGYDEINEFEAQQSYDGTNVVKVFLHVTQEVQDERLKARLDHPWKRWKVTPDDFRNRAHRADYLDAIHDMFAHTNTRWGPWHVIDGNNKKAARILTLTTIAEALEQAVKMKPPEPSPEVQALALKAFGKDG